MQRRKSRTDQDLSLRRSKTRTGAAATVIGAAAATRSRTGGGFKERKQQSSSTPLPSVSSGMHSVVRSSGPEGFLPTPTASALALGLKRDTPPPPLPTTPSRRPAPEVIKIPVDRDKSKLQWFGPPGEVVPGLWVGSMEHASPSSVRDHGFNTIVSVMRYSAFGGPPQYPNEVEYHNYPYCDNGTDSIPFEEIAMKINESLARQLRVLVHCKQGISRSVSTVIAYLVLFRGMSFEDSLAAVKSARPAAAPKFSSQLKDLCQQNRKRQQRQQHDTLASIPPPVYVPQQDTLPPPPPRRSAPPRTSLRHQASTPMSPLRRFASKERRPQQRPDIEMKEKEKEEKEKEKEKEEEKEVNEKQCISLDDPQQFSRDALAACKTVQVPEKKEAEQCVDSEPSSCPVANSQVPAATAEDKEELARKQARECTQLQEQEQRQQKLRVEEEQRQFLLQLQLCQRQQEEQRRAVEEQEYREREHVFLNNQVVNQLTQQQDSPKQGEDKGKDKDKDEEKISDKGTSSSFAKRVPVSRGPSTPRQHGASPLSQQQAQLFSRRGSGTWRPPMSPTRRQVSPPARTVRKENSFGALSPTRKVSCPDFKVQEPVQGVFSRLSSASPTRSLSPGTRQATATELLNKTRQLVQHYSNFMEAAEVAGVPDPPKIVRTRLPESVKPSFERCRSTPRSHSVQFPPKAERRSTSSKTPRGTISRTLDTSALQIDPASPEIRRNVATKKGKTSRGNKMLRSLSQSSTFVPNRLQHQCQDGI